MLCSPSLWMQIAMTQSLFAGLSTSLTGAVPPIPLETFQGPSTVPLRSRSSSLGVASAKDFDFVGVSHSPSSPSTMEANAVCAVLCRWLL